MISKGEYKKIILEKIEDIDYDETTDTITYKGVSIPFEKVYQNFIKKANIVSVYGWFFY